MLNSAVAPLCPEPVRRLLHCRYRAGEGGGAAAYPESFRPPCPYDVGSPSVSADRPGRLLGGHGAPARDPACHRGRAESLRIQHAEFPLAGPRQPVLPGVAPELAPMQVSHTFCHISYHKLFPQLVIDREHPAAHHLEGWSQVVGRERRPPTRLPLTLANAGFARVSPTLVRGTPALREGVPPSAAGARWTLRAGPAFIPAARPARLRRS